MTLHLTWMTPVWILAGVGAGVIVAFIIRFIAMILFFHD